MSSTSGDTRTRILVAARRLLEERGYHGVGLEDIAAAAGVSRQAIYLHFGSKGNLLLELVRHVDESQGLPALLAHFRSATTSLEALDRLVHIHATYGPRVLRIAAVFDGARRSDPDAEAAWRDRLLSRLGAARSVVEWLARDGLLADGWTVEDAAEWWWALSSPATQELLVSTRSWTADRYEKLMRKAVHAVLVKTDATGVRSSPAPAAVRSRRRRSSRTR